MVENITFLADINFFRRSFRQSKLDFLYIDI